MKKINLQQTIMQAYDRKYSFLSLKVDTVWSEAYEIKKYRNDNFVELASICESLIGDAELSVIDDTGSEEYCLIYENKDSNKTNNEGVVNMTREELRIELAKYEVVFSNTQFKATNKKELVDMLTAKQSNKEVVTMEQPQQLPQVVPVMSLEDLMANVTNNLDVTKLVGKQVIKSEANITNHISKESQSVISALTKKIDELNATVVGLVNGQATTVNYSNVTNPNQTNGQYNKKASELKPLGYVFNEKTGKQEAYFGICSVCGSKIKSAKVVEFSISRFGKVVCYVHQGQQQLAPKDNTPVTHKCMYCGIDAEFENTATFLKLSKYAKSQGLAPCAHIACWKAAKATIVNAQEVMNNQPPATESFKKIEKETPIQKPSEVIIPEGNIWMQSPVNNAVDGNEAY